MSEGIIVVGAGARGLAFIQMLTRQLHRKVVAVVENNPDKEELVRRRLKVIGAPNTPLVRTFAKALPFIPAGSRRVVFIMTPEWQHLPIFRQAIAADCHIFLEKPVATTRRDALEIRRLARRSPRVVHLGFVLRFAPFYEKIKRIVDSGALGTLVSIQMNERLGFSHGACFHRGWHRKKRYTGGIINEKCCHDLDLLCWLKEKQSTPSKVMSFGGRNFFPHRDTPERCEECGLRKCPWRMRLKIVDPNMLIRGALPKDPTVSDWSRCVFRSDSDVMDHQCVQIAFADGTQGVFNFVTSSSTPGRDLLIHGSDGYLAGDLQTGTFTYQNYWSGRTKRVSVGALGPHGGGDVGIVEEFLKNVAHNRKPVPGVEEGVRASLIAFAADQSVATGRAVTLRS